MATLLISHPLKADEEPPFQLPPSAELKRVRSAIIYTNKGNLYVRLFPEEAPWHVANFKYLADKGFYRNVPFHLHEPGYIIQGGAPGKKANSGPGYTLPPEFNQHNHTTGVLSMVRRPNDLDIEHTRRSHGSQFRILLQNAPHMNGQFTVFGKVIKGIKVAQKLRKNDLIKNIVVFVQAAPEEKQQQQQPLERRK
jgi:cyclophilin family peptidyl-prolyl cis-trans isomerase